MRSNEFSMLIGKKAIIPKFYNNIKLYAVVWKVYSLKVNTYIYSWCLTTNCGDIYIYGKLLMGKFSTFDSTLPSRGAAGLRYFQDEGSSVYTRSMCQLL